MTRRNILLLVLGLVVTGIKCQDEVDCTFSDNCNAEGDGNSIALYTCAKGDGAGGGAPKCTCAKTGATEDVCPAAEEITVTADTIKDSCESLCNSTSTCEFFKYTKDADLIGGTKKCYLMDINQCNSPGSNPCHNDDHCAFWRN